MGGDDDLQLLERWQAGVEAAGAELFRRYYPAILRFFRSKVGPQAPDLVQRTFLGCLEARPRIREGANFRSFLFGVARNVLLMHFRGSRRERERIDFTERSAEDLGASPVSLLAREREAQLLLQALRSIPLEYQIVLELYYWEGLNSREIADIDGTPEPTIRTRLRRAKLRLEARLGELESNPQVVQATATNLEGWARRLREQLDRSPS
ncbi:MAG: RNA polymerase sigma factor [Myxococcales bacterium]|nr:RNA polymerase sigma factor [Myxococcales bacterium]MCB9703144.1 RNA polymerase sigma factor [Myxococcales bacterium]